MTAHVGRALTLATMLWLGAAPRLAHAQPSAEDKALATALFMEARQLLEQSQVAEACRKFQESQRIDPSGGTLLNLAACHEKLGRTASAWTEYNEAIAWARRDDRADRVEFAAEHMKALEPRLSYIIVEVPPNVRLDGLEIRRDGSVLHKAAWGLRMPVDPGTHVIEAAATGYHNWRSEILIDSERQEQRVIVPVLYPLPVSVVPTEPVDDVVGPEADTPSRDTVSSGGVPWTAYVLGGVGVVSLGVGSYFGLRAFSKDREADDECETGCSPDGLRLTDEAGDAADISTVAFAVGIVALGAGVTVWMLEPDEPSTASRVAPTVGPDGAGLLWRGRF